MLIYDAFLWRAMFIARHVSFFAATTITMLIAVAATAIYTPAAFFTRMSPAFCRIHFRLWMMLPPAPLRELRRHRHGQAHYPPRLHMLVFFFTAADTAFHYAISRSFSYHASCHGPLFATLRSCLVTLRH